MKTLTLILMLLVTVACGADDERETKETKTPTEAAPPKSSETPEERAARDAQNAEIEAANKALAESLEAPVDPEPIVTQEAKEEAPCILAPDPGWKETSCTEEERATILAARAAVKERTKYVINAMYSIKRGQSLGTMLPEAKELILAEADCSTEIYGGGRQTCRVEEAGQYNFRIELDAAGAVRGVYDEIAKRWTQP